MKPIIPKFPIDYAVVLLALVAANFFASIYVNEDLRSVSYLERQAEIESLSSDASLDLLLLGDSRSEKLEIGELAQIHGHHADRFFNASTISGSWVTSYSLLAEISPHLSANARTVLCISEFWLEKPDFQDVAGIVPCWHDYYSLNQPLVALNAFFPLSRKRGNMIHSIHLGIAASRVWMGDFLNNCGGFATDTDVFLNPSQDSSISNGVAKESSSPMGKSNVDWWFPSITDEQLRGNFVFADHVLGMMQKMTPRLILVYLPNAETRETFVSRRYPGRKERFIGNIHKLADKHGLHFVDMSNETELREDSLFEDFHHWNPRGSSQGAKRLARILQVELDD